MKRRRESVNERYLRRRVEETGGEVIKVGWPGRRGAPDDLCRWPDLGVHAFVELKSDEQDWDDQPHQIRERRRMHESGMCVELKPLSTPAEIDAFVTKMTYR
jgi:hypothetical protein